MPKIRTPAMEKLDQKRAKQGGKEKKYSFFMDAWKRLCRNRTAVIGLIIIVFLLLVGVFADIIAPYDPAYTDYTAAYSTPTMQHIFGTDNLGRDIFSRCVYGARYSMPIGIACMMCACLVGGALGLLASFFGGRTDMVIMRLMDVLQAIPGTLMAITIVAVLDSGIPQLILAITISFTPGFSKTVRAAIFTVRNSEYIDACRSVGARNFRLMINHMLPNAVGHIIIYAVGIVSASILTVSMLSYIGLGIKAPTPEWGSLLSAGREFLQSYPHMVLFPGLLIMLVVLAFNLLGDGLRDALDPRLK